MDRYCTRVAALVLVVLAAGPLLSAQQAQEQPPPDAAAKPSQTPTFRTGTELVTLDVGVVDRQGLPVRELKAGDFTITVAGQPRRVVTAEYVDTSTAPVSVLSTDAAHVSTNEGSGIGRLIVFIVDQSSLEAGSVRQISGAAGRFLDRLTFADRSALWLLPVGGNISFTWNHTRVRDALGRVSGLASMSQEWQYGTL